MPVGPFRAGSHVEQLLLQELERRWASLFDRLAAGDDLPPGPRLRTEGMMEAALLLGLATEEELTRRMAAAYRRSFGEELAQVFGADWRQCFPFPSLPAMARRAPVVPSTAD